MTCLPRMRFLWRGFDNAQLLGLETCYLPFPVWKGKLSDMFWYSDMIPQLISRKDYQYIECAQFFITVAYAT